MKLRIFILSAVLATAVFIGCTSAPATPDAAGEIAQPAPGTSTLLEDVAGLGLNGSLILIRFVDGSPILFSLDLDSGELKNIFNPPRGAWITAASASPVTEKIAIAYAAAPEQGQSQRGFTGISLLPLGGEGAPEEFLQAVEEELLYSFPEWSPDGTSIYFNQFQFGTESSGAYVPIIGRQAYPQGDSADLVEFGQWPRLSSDSQRMVYVSVGEGGSENLSEALLILDLVSEGAEPFGVSVGPQIEVLDVPMFSPDGRMIFFSAPTASDAESEGQLSLADRLMGVQIAQAHDVPSEWWRVPVEGGVAERLTEIGETGMYGDFSPDGSHMAFISNRGVHVMEPDGSGLETLIEAEGFFGTIDWVP